MVCRRTSRPAGKDSGWRVRSNGAGSPSGGVFRFHQPLGAQNIGHARHRRRRAHRGRAVATAVAACLHQSKIEQPVRVIIGRAKHLPARQILVGRRNAAADRHFRGIDRHGRAKARQGGAEGAHQESGLDGIALRLLQRQRSEIAIIERALVHHAAQRRGPSARGSAQPRVPAPPVVAAPRFGEEFMRGENGGLAALDRDIHQPCLPDLVPKSSAAGP